MSSDVDAALSAVEDALRNNARRHANGRDRKAEDGDGPTADDVSAPADLTAADERAVAVAALDGWLEDTIAQRLRSHSDMSEKDVGALRRAVLARLFDLGELQPLLDDDEIETIHVNGAGRVFVRDAEGRTRRIDALVDGDDEQLLALVRRLAAHEGLGERRWDTGAPALNLTLRDGSRLHGLMAVTRRPCLTIRRHRLLDVDLDGLVELGTIPRGVARLLAAAIQVGQSIVVAGGPGAGKSSTVRGLASAIPPARRIVTIEDTLELHLDLDEERHPDCVAIETRPANIEGRGEITVTATLREALRMDPDVLIVGEVRIDETVPMLLALAAGNIAGSLSTVHAFSSAQALEQLQTYAMVGPDRMPGESSARLIGSALDWVVHIERRADSRRGARRVITSVREVCGSQGIHVRSNEVFRHDRDGHVDVHAGVSDETRERLLQADYHVSELEEAGRFVG
ncbi:MAG TPA: ATPase, T2SS/T4P/T4SS family [Candidatus Angelobacter sp.]|jgi:Flp pilus assembly CpaF family ATPase|nr:ATPase, T2SS/T4P/T4SS family [Candidatus Angelobacter sp.]